MKSKYLWIIFLLLLFVSSYYREVLFKSINAIIEGEQFFYAKTRRIEYLESWSRSELMRFKYILTLSFSVLFILLTSFGLRLSFVSKTPFYLSIIAYGLIILMVFLIALYGTIFSSFGQVYSNLRMLVGWVHNPLIYLLISIGTLGFQNLSTNESEK